MAITFENEFSYANKPQSTAYPLCGGEHRAAGGQWRRSRGHVGVLLLLITLLIMLFITLLLLPGHLPLTPATPRGHQTWIHIRG
jgi:hypothetical protein